jgi:hypothetical protein
MEDVSLPDHLGKTGSKYQMEWVAFHRMYDLNARFLNGTRYYSFSAERQSCVISSSRIERSASCDLVWHSQIVMTRHPCSSRAFLALLSRSTLPFRFSSGGGFKSK